MLKATGCTLKSEGILLETGTMLDTTFLLIENFTKLKEYFRCPSKSLISEGDFDSDILLHGIFPARK